MQPGTCRTTPPGAPRWDDDAGRLSRCPPLSRPPPAADPRFIHQGIRAGVCETDRRPLRVQLFRRTRRAVRAARRAARRCGRRGAPASSDERHRSQRHPFRRRSSSLRRLRAGVVQHRSRSGRAADHAANQSAIAPAHLRHPGGPGGRPFVGAPPRPGHHRRLRARAGCNLPRKATRELWQSGVLQH